MSPRETIAFLLTAPSKSQAVNGFVGLAAAQMGLKYGFMSLFSIVKGQQEQEIIAEPLIYGERRPLAPLLPLHPRRRMLSGRRVTGSVVEPCRASVSPKWQVLGGGHLAGCPRHGCVPCLGDAHGEVKHPHGGRGEGTGEAGAPRNQPPLPWLAWASVGRAGGPLARPAPRAALSCFANPAWHLPQLPAASREQGTN